MTKQELQGLLNNLRKQTEKGKNRFDLVLANLFLKTEADVDKDIANIIGLFKNKRNKEPTAEEIAAAYVLYEEKTRKIEEQELKDYIEKNEEELEIEEERRVDEIQENSLETMQEQREKEEEPELFLLDRIGEHSRLQVREEIEERNLQDRQKALMERSLKILEALEKIRDAMKQEKGVLEIGGDIFKGMNSREIKQQLGILKAMGVQEISKDKSGNILENEGREISIETLTGKDIEDIEKGEIDLAIPLEALRSIEWKQQAEKMQEWFETRGVAEDKNSPTAVKGLEEPKTNESNKEIKIFEDEER